MSKVTSIILTTSLIENQEYLALNLGNYRVNGLPFNVKSIEDELLPQDWYGGSKRMGANIFIGAFNYLNIEELIEFLRTTIKWESPESVQLFVKEEGDLEFSVIQLFPTGRQQWR